MKEPQKRYDVYDKWADIYNRFWGERCLSMLMPIEMFVLSRIPEGGRILDLCCGTGQMSNALSERGYQVTGLDGSEEMIRIAKQRTQHTHFILSDARSFVLDEKQDAAVSLLDSLNHIPTLDDLIAVFENVYANLNPGAPFFFDLRMEEGFLYYWGGGDDREELPNIIEDDLVFAPKTVYDPETRTGYCHYALFRRETEWERFDVKLVERYFTQAEITTALAQVGFKNAEMYNVKEDLGFDIIGRSIFVCNK